MLSDRGCRPEGCHILRKLLVRDEHGSAPLNRDWSRWKVQSTSCWHLTSCKHHCVLRVALIPKPDPIKLASVSRPSQRQHHVHSDEHHQNQDPRGREIREAVMLLFAFFFRFHFGVL